MRYAFLNKVLNITEAKGKCFWQNLSSACKAVHFYLVRNSRWRMSPYFHLYVNLQQWTQIGLGVRLIPCLSHG